jgi:hypothetical protein
LLVASVRRALVFLHWPQTTPHSQALHGQLQSSQSTNGVIAKKNPEHNFISGSDEALLVSIEMPPDKRNELIAQLP